MKSSILFCFLVLSASFVRSQVSSSDQKKILRLVGQDFVQQEPKSNYPFGLHPEMCIVDTSTTIVGDTTGLIFNNEYVLFRDFIHFQPEKELFSLIKSNVVTLGEYKEFKKYVRDSIARVKIIIGLEEEEEGIKYLTIARKAKRPYEVLQNIRNNERSFLYCEYQLDWKQEIPYLEYAPLFIDMYVPRNERFRLNRVFDECKFQYQYFEFLPTSKMCSDFKDRCGYFNFAESQRAVVNFELSIADDVTLWAKNATHNDDERGILSQLYGEMSTENPAVGSLGTQAKAFCNWKQRELQRNFNKKKLPFRVIVTLPTPDQQNNPSSSLKIPTHDYSDQWRITKSKYIEFKDYIFDSIQREIIYCSLLEDAEALKYINYFDRYLGEGAFEFLDLDPSDRDMNRELFSLNFKTKIKRKHIWDEQVKRSLKEAGSSAKLVEYNYSTIRTIARVTSPEYKIGDSSQYNSLDLMFFDSISRKELPLTRKTIDNRDMVNQLGYGSGVRSLDKLDLYIEAHSASVIVGDLPFHGDQSSLIPSLSYEQALAFYNWKYPIDKFTPKSNWQDFVYPSEEEFNAIQKGESIVIPEHEVEFPTPLFRYVVHIFPKD